MKHRKEISPEEVKQLQLSVLEEVDVFCRQNGLTYFLMFGTLIGAVRHKGYIPWDDDIDIAMLRADYDKFIATFRPRNNDMAIECYETNPRCIYPFAKVYNTNTVFYDSNEKHALGVNIDIFPIDYIPAEREVLRKVLKKASVIRNIGTLKYLQVDPQRSLLKNAVVVAGKALKLIPDRFLATKLHRYQQTVTEDTGFVGMITGGGNCNAPVVYTTSTFDGTVDMEFEGRHFLAPREFHEVLTREFGDYMQLPPEDKRVSHHKFYAYWK